MKVTSRNCFRSYILYLGVKRSQCCQNIPALLLWHLQSTCFFIEKIYKIKMEFPLLEACLPAYSFDDIDTIMPVCTAVFDTFQPYFCDVLASIIHKLNRTTCGLDLFPTKLLMSHLSSIINIILRIVNLCFSSGDFPASCKSAIISPWTKKQGLDSEILKKL